MSDSANLETLNKSVQLISSKIDFLSDNLEQRLDAMDKRIDHSTGLAWLALLMSFCLVCFAGVWFFL